MADFKAFWQRFKSGENGGKGQKDRFMLLALVGLLILVAIWPVGGKVRENIRSDRGISGEKAGDIV